MLTSLFRRARYVGHALTMVSHCENDHYALALVQPPPREYIFPVIRSASFPHFSPVPSSFLGKPQYPLA